MTRPILRSALLAALPLALATPLAAQDEAPPPPTPGSVIAASHPSEWRTIAPADLMVMDLAPDAKGNPRRVVIQLMPAPFSQPWVENIRTMARAHWWDGKSIYRVVDNWVVQWGGGDPELDMDPGPLPEGVASPKVSYDVNQRHPSIQQALRRQESAVDALLTRMRGERMVGALRQAYGSDAYAERTGFVDGWPFAASDREVLAWPVHCYASVGVARDLAPDTGTGSELYAVIGHAPRQLDRNIAVVGRVIEGIEHMSVLPRGTAEAGVYATRAEDTPILSVRLADELADPPAFEYLSTDSASFARYVEVRANRHDAFYEQPAGGIDICNVGVPVREAKASE